MLEPYRTLFNEQQFTPERYAELLRQLDERTGTHVEFRVAETPVFFPRELLAEMIDAGRELTHQLLDSPEYLQRSQSSIPDAFRIPDDGKPPHFMTVDFGLVRGADGRLTPKLVELQAFPSIYGYQDVMCQQYMETYGLDPALQFRFSGLDEAGYWSLLGRTILGEHSPENVILMEVEPEKQKTLPDFLMYRKRLGVESVDVRALRKEGSRLFYQRDGQWTPVHRIFNRAIVDEMIRKEIQPAWDYREPVDVEWAGHPNWYFRISKFSLPYLNHPTVPRALFLSDWFDGGPGRQRLEEVTAGRRDRLLLKPLYSFAGKGIQFSPTDEDLLSIPPEQRGDYLLQERVFFEPVIRTPHGMTQAEVRIMYLRPDGARAMTPVTSLIRLGRGLMMGVDHNRNQQWIGGSSVFFPAAPSGITLT